MPIITSQNPPPLAGYIECPPGSRQYVYGSSCPSGSSSPGGTPVPGGSIPTTPVAIPIANFIYTVYADGIVGFVNKSLGSISSYSWKFGDGTYSTTPNPVHKYNYSGVMTVELIVKNSSGQSSKILSVNVPTIPLPETVDFTYETGALAVQFTDISNKSGTRIWNFGDGTYSYENSPYKIYDSPGIYTVTLSIGSLTKSYVVPVDYGIILQWQDNSSDETGFKIERSPDGSTAWVLIATVGAGIQMTTITKNLHGIDPSIENHFRVYAYNGDGSSGYTNIVETLCEGI